MNTFQKEIVKNKKNNELVYLVVMNYRKDISISPYYLPYHPRQLYNPPA